MAPPETHTRFTWTLAGQLSAASASNTFSEELTKNIDEPLDWIDRATGGQSTLYLGQRLTDYNGLWQMEFWNRSLDHVWSTDGSAPGPGPVVTPDLIELRNLLQCADLDPAVIPLQHHDDERHRGYDRRRPPVDRNPGGRWRGGGRRHGRQRCGRFA